MGFFNFFRKDNATVANTVPLHVATGHEATTEVPGADYIPMEENKKSDEPLTVTYATGWPIDIIYGHLHRNYEEKGFEDSMVRNDLAFRDMNMNLISNKVLMVFREVNLNYDAKKHDLQTRINMCNSAGLISSVADLETTLNIIESHKAELQKLEADFRNNPNEAVPLQSYSCGFLRGVASIALGSPVQQDSAKLFGNNKSIA